MIIVEGPDGAGKSRLAMELAIKLNLSVGRFSTLMAPDMQSLRGRVYESLGNAVIGHDRPHIHDRFFFSELVYGPALRRKCRFSQNEMDYVMRVLRAMKVPIIFCLPPLDAIMENTQKSEQMEGVLQNIDLIYKNYLDLADYLAGIGSSDPAGLGKRYPSFHEWDYTNTSEDSSTKTQITREVKRYLVQRKEREWKK